MVDLTFDRHMATTVEVTPYSNGSNFTAILTPGTSLFVDIVVDFYELSFCCFYRMFDLSQIQT